MDQLSQDALDLIFNNARSHTKFLNKDVPNSLLEQVYDLTKMAPTSANCSPMRVLFVKTPDAKEKLKPCLMEGNVDKAMAAPVCAVIAQDMKFYDELPRLFPHTDAKAWFVGKDAYIESTAMRNSSLQGAYFILAARALGLDCGPMSGFSPKKLDEAFFAGTSWKSNFLINLGYGDESVLHSRGPRLGFNEACKIA